MSITTFVIIYAIIASIIFSIGAICFAVTVPAERDSRRIAARTMLAAPVFPFVAAGMVGWYTGWYSADFLVKIVREAELGR